jgi:hypothetical protein
LLGGKVGVATRIFKKLVRLKNKGECCSGNSVGQRIEAF